MLDHLIFSNQSAESTKTQAEQSSLVYFVKISKTFFFSSFFCFVLFISSTNTEKLI